MVRGVSMPFPDPVGSRRRCAVLPGRGGDWLRRTGRGNNVDLSMTHLRSRCPTVRHLRTWSRCCAGTSSPARISAADRTAGAAGGTRSRRHLAPRDSCSAGVRCRARVRRRSGGGVVGGPTRCPESRLDASNVAARDLTPEAVKLLRDGRTAGVYLDHDGVVLRTEGSPLASRSPAVPSTLWVTIERSVVAQPSVAFPSAATTVASCVSALSLVGLDIGDTLDGVDEVVVGLAGGHGGSPWQRPALSDDLAGTLQHRRARTLRVGNLVAAVRLPRGCGARRTGRAWRRGYASVVQRPSVPGLPISAR